MHLFETGEMPHYYTIYLVKIKPTKKIIPTNVWGNINLYRHNKDWRHEPSLKTDKKNLLLTHKTMNELHELSVLCAKWSPIICM